MIMNMSTLSPEAPLTHLSCFKRKYDLR